VTSEIANSSAAPFFTAQSLLDLRQELIDDKQQHSLQKHPPLVLISLSPCVFNIDDQIVRPWFPIRSAWFSSGTAASWSYTSCIPIEAQFYGLSWPFCGRRAWFVHQIPFAWSRNDAFLEQSWMPYQTCIGSPCGRHASCIFRHSRSCVLSGHLPLLRIYRQNRWVS
jgi:hypothetical protein